MPADFEARANETYAYGLPPEEGDADEYTRIVTQYAETLIEDSEDGTETPIYK